MAVTASRLGNSPITLDWSHLPRKYTPDPAYLGEGWNRLKQNLNTQENPQASGYYDAPINPEISQVTEAQALADLLIKKNQFTDCLFLGIGGSALGPISLVDSLQDRTTTGIRFHFVENPDPVDWRATLKGLRPDSTLVCVITKSGTTVETLAQMLLALDWLGKELWKSHLVIITDPKKGDLRSFVNDEGLMSLSVAPSLGGRYSVFSPVGLFPAALAGLNTAQILLGAKQVRDAIEKTPFEKNPIFIVGSELIRYYPKRNIHVFMPYSTRLRSVGAWFTQLWAESLGKDGKGFSPIAALGATDQHSILQLLRDGPDDKVTFFTTVDKVNDECVIPKSPRGNYSTFRLLEGHSLKELLQVEYQATSLVLTKQMRPHITIGLDQLDERALGALFFMLCNLTAYTGTLWDVNPFDQPGVEEGKVYIHKALSQEAL